MRVYGVLTICFSWRTADAFTRSLREALDEADREMYAMKRARAADGAARQHPPAR